MTKIDKTDTLFSITESIHTKLPRELRDIVYQHIWDKNTPNCVQGCINIAALLAFVPNPKSKRSPSSEWPAYLQPGKMNQAIRTELVQYFYETAAKLYIYNPKKIAPFFSKDLIETGLTLADCTINTL
ncbi:hypothetical protein CC86DRAFT_403686 [Ophiobolus disseminans]|uniref:Uncharacterized protein n=1 Tax=Ophiobolus disseminans TaxID=1469910 RepID=A0A6A7A776_9PLEO|nr:hypothetical protein CC86DRAFT_403686 [Ophiobolus disseminans]